MYILTSLKRYIAKLLKLLTITLNPSNPKYLEDNVEKAKLKTKLYVIVNLLNLMELLIDFAEENMMSFFVNIKYSGCLNIILVELPY